MSAATLYSSWRLLRRGGGGASSSRWLSQQYGGPGQEPLLGQLTRLLRAYLRRQQDGDGEGDGEGEGEGATDPFKRKTKPEKRADLYARRRQRMKEKGKASRQKKGEMLRSMPREEAQLLVAERRRIKSERQEKMEAIARIDQPYLAGSGGPSTALELKLTPHLRLAVDLGVGVEVNDDRCLRSLGMQLMYGWSWIKAAPTWESTAILHLFGYQGKVREVLDRQGVCHWPIHRHPGSPHEAFPPDRLVYLSPDSDNVLQELDVSRCYVIGGIVDRTIRNHISMERARALGIETGRLPLDDHIQLRKSKNNKVLNVDSVIHALVKYQETGGDWSQALEAAVCPRKKEKGEEEEATKEQGQGQGGRPP